MRELGKNIINLFGDRGKHWLEGLPGLIEKVSDNWQLTDIQPVGNMSWNYVARANSKQYGLVVLKISCDENIIDDEAQALEYFSGYGMVELIKHDKKYNAMLLRQGVPGDSLKTIYPGMVDLAVQAYAGVVEKIISVSQQNKRDFKHISKWFKVFERVGKSIVTRRRFYHSRTKNQESIDLLQRAVDLKNSLLETRGKEFVLHGDLHLDNVISDKNNWIAIDPKGIVGEIEFETAAFNFIHKSELNDSDVPKLFEERSKLLADRLNLDHQRLKDWVFVRFVLGACWMIEDGGDPSIFLDQCRVIFIL